MVKQRTIISVGKTESKILEELARNPNQLIKPLSKALKKDYKTVYEGVINLYKKGYLTKVTTKSEKGVEYKGYKLSEKGISYVLATNNVDIDKIIEEYEENSDYRLIQFYRKLGSRLGDKTLLKKIAKQGGQIFLIAENNSEADTILSLSTGITLATTHFTEQDKVKLRKAFQRERKIQKDLKRLFKDLGL